MRFDFTDLRLFIHVAETGSLTQGAKRSNLALPSASLRVRGMETALGAALLNRHSRKGVTLTAAGQALLDHARIVFGQIETMRGELGAYAGGLKGTVRLLSNGAATGEYLPEALAAFLAANPSVDIELEEQPSAAIAQAVIGRRAEIGILADGVDLSGLQTFPFRLDRLVLVVPRRHVLARRRQLSFADVLGEPFVGLSRDSALQDHIGRHAARLGKRLNLRVRVSNFESICRMVERGVGIAIIPDAAARRFRRSMAIDTLRLREPWTVRHLVICVRQLDALSPQARRLVAHLRARGDARAQARPV
jgi:DNA-binding transcriptional LysR family regulator